MTINEIARLAGVSKSTVSRVLNNSKSVSEQTRKKILEIIETNDYIPSAMARGLSNRSSNTIGWILPEIDGRFYGPVTEGIYETLSDTQYSLMLSCTQNNVENELRALRDMRQQNICGLLLTSASAYEGDEGIEKVRKALEELNIPIILIDHSIKNTPYNAVFTDNFNGSYEVTEVLINAGFTEIGGLFSDLALNQGQQRYNAFQLALRDHGLNACAVHLEDGPAKDDDFYRVTKQLIASNKLPKAIILGNGVIANGFFKAILEEGIRPGIDIHCMSFDHLEALEITGIPYSYLKRNCKLFGQTAAKALIRTIHEKPLVREELIVPAVLQIDPTLK